MYEVFGHTADLGLRVRARDLNQLFADAGKGLFSVIVETLADVRPKNSATIEIKGTDREYLLFDWLNELLYRFDSGHLVFSQFEVQVDDAGLNATVRGEWLDPERHRLDHEVKAITYHGLKVRETAEGWEAEVIVDI